MDIYTSLLSLLIGSFFLWLLAGYPIAWVLGGSGLLTGFMTWALYENYGSEVAPRLNDKSLAIMAQNVGKLLASDVLVAIPLFIFMGLMLDKSGLAERMMQSMQLLFGRLRGGLALTVVLIGVILAASTGIVGASVVLLGLLALPIMLQQGYSKSLATGTICASGTMGILMPPSIMLVVMADRADTSVGNLFMGAVFPSLILGLCYIGYIVVMGFWKPEQAPPAASAQKEESIWPMVKRVIADVVPALLLIVAVLGSIIGGVATPTQAASIGALAAGLLAFAGPGWGAVVVAVFIGLLGVNYGIKELGGPEAAWVPLMARIVFLTGCGLLTLFAFWRSWPRLSKEWNILPETAIQTVRTCGYIFAIFMGAAMFAYVFKRLGGDHAIELGLNAVGGSLGNYGLIAVVLFLVFALGFFLDWIEICIIVLPLIAPVIAAADLGIVGLDGNGGLVWFLILMAMCLQTSFLTPPVGFSLFFLKGVAPPEVALKDIYKGVIPFVALQLLALAIVAMFPALVIWLPEIIFK